MKEFKVLEKYQIEIFVTDCIILIEFIREELLKL